MVPSDATKDTLETRLDSPHSSSHHIQKSRCEKGRVPSPRRQSTSTNQKRPLLHRPGHPTPPRKRGRPPKDPPTLPTPCEGLQRTTIPKAPGPLNLGPRHRTPPRRPSHPSRKTTPLDAVGNTGNSQIRS